jgi:hypothetical protein
VCVVDVTVTECPNCYTINRRQIICGSEVEFCTVRLGSRVRRVEIYVGSKCASFQHFRFSGTGMMRIRECNSDAESVM